MLTLDELKTAVAETESTLGDNPESSVGLVWILGAIKFLKALWRFARDYIAREQLLDTPLTAEICEQLGMGEKRISWGITQFLLPGLEVRHYRQGDSYVLAGNTTIENPTIRHLLAAACLAGVEIDINKLTSKEIV